MRVPPDQSTHARRAGGERIVGIARLQRARDVGEPRAEQEGRDALARVGHGMEEVQEQPRVLAHRAGNIEQRDDRRHLRLRPEIFQVDERAAGLHAGAQGAAHVDDVAAPMRRQAARAHLVERQHQLADGVLGGRDLGRRHLREILALQKLPVRHREPRVEFDFALLALVASCRAQRTMRPGCAASPASASRPARRAAPAASSSTSAARDRRACGRTAGTPDRTAPNARAASRTRRAASSRSHSACRRRPPSRPPAHRAPRRARPECRRRAARGRSRGCSRRGGLRALSSIMGALHLPP